MARSSLHGSKLGNKHTDRAKTDKECSEGGVLGSFKVPLVPNLRVYPLGVVAKKTAGEFRLIHHLIFLQGGSVNDAIPEHLCLVKYTSFDQAV